MGLNISHLASNSFDVPSSQDGPVSAIQSDNADRLAVFKDKAYYDVIGDLDAGAFSINIKNEGEVGIPSQASLARVRGMLVGVSRLGLVVISNGELDMAAFRKINARLINQAYRFEWALGVNDYTNRNYICSIPTGLAADPVCVNPVIDYSRETFKFFETSYNTNVAPSAALLMYNGALVMLNGGTAKAAYARLPRYSSNSPAGSDGDSFLDMYYPITYILESQPMTFGEPAQTKVPIRLRMWSIPNDGVINGWVPWSCVIDGGPIPIDYYLGSTYPQGMTTTLTFSNPQTDWFKDVKIPTCKAQFYIVRFTTAVARQAPFISGYEIMFALAYEKEDLIK
jgi:hypothetical protein